MKDPLVQYAIDHPRAKTYPQWVFSKRFKMGFSNSPNGMRIAAKKAFECKSRGYHTPSKDRTLCENCGDSLPRRKSK